MFTIIGKEVFYKKLFIRNLVETWDFNHYFSTCVS